MSAVFDKSRPYLIAGPCAAESAPQLMECASALADCGLTLFRAGLWKPRTRPGCFEGVGEQGLEWLSAVRARYGLKVCTEVASPAHVEACLNAGIDAVWIGARTTANPFQMQDIASSLRGTSMCVLVKNPVSPDISLWAGAVERLERENVGDIALVHRGFGSQDPAPYRNAPMWQLAVRMRMLFPQLPFLCDPSHIAGSASLVPDIASRALSMGLDGLMVEVHPNPQCAMSDAAQQLSPDAFRELLKSLPSLSGDSPNSAYRLEMEQLRSRIDECDDAIVNALAARMDASRRIGEVKKVEGVTIIQQGRWSEVLKRVLAAADAAGLSQDFVRELYDAIHEESVRVQNDKQ